MRIAQLFIAFISIALLTVGVVSQDLRINKQNYDVSCTPIPKDGVLCAELVGSASLDNFEIRGADLNDIAFTTDKKRKCAIKLTKL